ncbi:hypothetical protein [Acidianus manzaensis]|uniref:Uncharacterized protein n=1 Tax=Acidianus manzaensis TaxID=282676 RepID=A0A1W6JZE8_9CREN|nr:hypothetical protein [Acidianus manzaensis]ARM75612.1 hypothetical protein B6F84_05875 [Acidianus manzaensis]
MDHLDDVILQQIYNECLKKNKYWNCIANELNLLPYSKETKKIFMLKYIKKYLGINTFIAGILSKSIFNCINSNKNNDEIECYIRIYDHLEDLPPLLPDEILIRIHKTVRILLTEKRNDIENLCNKGNEIACEILENDLL